jgi:hypothetical protein
MHVECALAAQKSKAAAASGDGKNDSKADSKAEVQAATKIQALYRAQSVRKVN